MEAFTPWDDKVSGVNPFVPSLNKKTSTTITWFFSCICMVPLLLIKVPMVLVLLAIFLLCICLFQIAYFGILKKIVYVLLLSPTTKLLLFSIGVFTQEKYADTRKLRLRSIGTKRVNNKNRTYGQGVKSGDVILSNYTNFTEILYILSQFTPVFVNVSKNGSAAIRISPLKALVQSITLIPMNSNNSSNYGSEKYSSSGCDTLSNVLKSEYFPVAIFPEGVQTNGKGLLHFLPILNDYEKKSKNKILLPSIHLLGFRYPVASPLPHTVGSWLTQTCKVLIQTVIKREAVFLGDNDVKLLVVASGKTNPAKDREGTQKEYLIRNKPKKAAANHISETMLDNEGDNQLLEPLRILMGSMIGIKLLDLTVKDFFEFYEFYQSHKLKGKQRGGGGSRRVIAMRKRK